MVDLIEVRVSKLARLSDHYRLLANPTETQHLKPEWARAAETRPPPEFEATSEAVPRLRGMPPSRLLSLLGEALGARAPSARRNGVARAQSDRPSPFANAKKTNDCG
jgi:hypothetical protein